MKTELEKCHKNESEDNLLSASNQAKSTIPKDRLIRSFGRIKSRKLSDHKKFLLENLLPKYEINDDFLAQKNNDFAKKSFEIGFGFGDFLFEKAKANPTEIFIGCEPHINGVVNLLGKLEKEPLKNVKISLNDSRLLLQKFDDEFFDEFRILFPDPWPKIKHFKRRLIDADFLDNLLAKKLKKGAKLTIATDHDSYKTWILSEILKSKSFEWGASSKQDWQVFPDDWVETKYQKKARSEGRVSVIFELIKK